MYIVHMYDRIWGDGTSPVFEESMDALPYADLQIRSLSQRYVTLCCAWYIQLLVDPVYDMFALALFSGVYLLVHIIAFPPVYF